MKFVILKIFILKKTPFIKYCKNPFYENSLLECMNNMYIQFYYNNNDTEHT